MGFFQQSQLLEDKAPISLIPRCGECGLYKKCKSPKMAVGGHGDKKILIIGEAPGEEEDNKNKPFIGQTGKLLEETLRKFGIDMRNDCWMTNALICRPPDDAEPKPSQIDSCRPNIRSVIERLKPEIILPVGEHAIKSLIGWLWKDKVGSEDRWIGWQIPHQKLNTWICPAWHPSYIYEFGEDDPQGKVSKVIWKNHLKSAVELKGRPWKEIPDYRKQVEIIIDPEEAAKQIRLISAFNSGYAAFDYETNCLKPDWDDAEIVCASICHNGTSTISFPWVGPVIDAFRIFLRSKIKKIASNIKFEERWSRKKLKTRVKNWWHCTMTGAHIHDNRRQITSIKFQSFVWLGVDSYNDHIAPFLGTQGDERINRVVKEIELSQLLLYCGMDSILEYHVAFKQRRSLGYEC